MQNVLYALLTLGILGGVFGLVLAIASKVFEVKVDPRLAEIQDNLPGANCGGCGYPGCSRHPSGQGAGKRLPQLQW